VDTEWADIYRWVTTTQFKGVQPTWETWIQLGRPDITKAQ
jgi:hypothetical protein